MKTDDKLFCITIPEFYRKYGIGKILNDNFIIISDISCHLEKLRFPLRTDALLIGITLNGQINMTVNLQEFAMTQNTCFICLPENLLGVQSTSNDYVGAIIGISLSYLKNMNINLKNIIPYYLSVCKHPIIQLDDNDMTLIKKMYELILSILTEGKSNYGRNEEVVTNLFVALVYRICDYFDNSHLNKEKLKTKSKEYYFVRFMDLLQNNFRQQRNIVFYSDELAVTPKYLSKLIKDISGSSAAQWIDEFTIAEASILLKFSDKNIQQIADYLNFPNQSFFSKYFKSHTGLSPSDWRGNIRKELL